MLLVILLVSYTLRLFLLQNEGHLSFPDEGRYGRARQVADNLYRGQYDAAIERLLRYGTHHAFTAFGLIPAYIHRVAFEHSVPETLTWDEYWNDGHADFRLSAAIFALPSVLAILMIYLIALEAGAGPAEAMLAAFFLAASNAMFMYSQHFLPYDSSLLVALAALWLAIRHRMGPAKYALPLGMLAFLAFWTYTGHYALVPVIALSYCVYFAPNVRQGALRAMGMTVGVLTILLPIYFVNLNAYGKDLIPELSRFSSTVTQGEYEAGFILPWQFLAHAERGIAFLWLFGLLMAIVTVRYSKSPQARDRLVLWIVSAALLYLTMALMSAALNIFVVYGRTARILVPFFALISAFACAPVLLRLAVPARLLIVVGICGLALTNLIPTINQVHYRVIQRFVMANYGDVSLESSFGNKLARYGPSMPRNEGARYILLNARYVYPMLEVVDRPEGKIVLEYEPYIKSRAWQYEGISSQSRDLINSYDLKIWLIDTHDTSD